KPARGPKTAPWSHADAVLVDEAAAALERVPGVGHVVLDEAQDLSPMELRAVGRRAATGSLTILGDIAQGTTPWATPSWPEALRHLAHDDAPPPGPSATRPRPGPRGRPQAAIEVLRKGYRVPAAVVEFAARLL